MQTGAERPATEGRADSGAGGGVEDLAEGGEVRCHGRVHHSASLIMAYGSVEASRSAGRLA
ncbi:hypothetical protein SBA4_3810014 [Candidatus Sulfopaludibacter sp. SbA4]|nr:hypothetical protein SBA4_3810014 [Candidatus Sulfopaludibacter sp. SbA4]